MPRTSRLQARNHVRCRRKTVERHPGHEFEIDRQAALGREVAETRNIVERPVPVGIVDGSHDMPGAEMRGGIEEGHIVVHPRFGDDARRVGIERRHARVGHRAQHFRLQAAVEQQGHLPAAGLGAEQAQADMAASGLRRDCDRLKRRQFGHRIIGEGKRAGHFGEGPAAIRTEGAGT